MEFRPKPGRLTYEYRHAPAIKAPTRIYVSPLHYHDGYQVKLGNGVARRHGRYVLVRPNSRRVVTVRAVPRIR